MKNNFDQIISKIKKDNGPIEDYIFNSSEDDLFDLVSDIEFSIDNQKPDEKHNSFISNGEGEALWLV